MNGPSCSKQSARWVRATAALTLSLAALSLSAGTASADPAAAPRTATATTAFSHLPQLPQLPHVPPHGVPQQITDELCARWEAVAAHLPAPAGDLPVCKLVNGWD
ncbi:hypothetical protein [Streptomyces sp. NPDC005805]|uniref:hypothetical protein n=1 Tax=Streptomyces sp. NPDC005805 TaxID=3157068 RepID=UPI003405AD65